MKTLHAFLLLPVAFVSAACGDFEADKEERAMSDEKVAQAAREEIDRLAAKVGTDPVVQQDAMVNCEFGDDDSGQYLSYSLRVKVTPGTLARVRGEIAEEYAAAGWTVRQDPEGTRFLKGGASMGAYVYEDQGGAAVGGSGGGC